MTQQPPRFVRLDLPPVPDLRRGRSSHGDDRALLRGVELAAVAHDATRSQHEAAAAPDFPRPMLGRAGAAA